MSTTQMRVAKLDDFDTVFSLLAQLWPTRVLDRSRVELGFVRGLANERAVFLCAEIEGKVAGFGTLSWGGNFWETEFEIAMLDELVVDEAFRGKGVGDALLAQLMKVAKEKGCKGVKLTSAVHRVEAHGFYLRRGFQELGTKVFFKEFV